MKFNCKLNNYHSSKADRGVFISPFVQSVSTLVDTENDRITVTFALQYDDSGVIKTLERATLRFDKVGQDTLIEDAEGNEVEILEFLSNGGAYDAAKITQWGIPSYTRVQDYFNLESIWNELEFKEQPFKQLAVDWLANTLKIDRKLVGENFAVN